MNGNKDMNSNGLMHEATEVLRELKRKQARMTKQINSLKQFDGWNLIPESKKRRGGNYYDVIRSNSHKRSYLGSEKNENVLNIKRYRYACKAKWVIDHDIRLLDSLVSNYVNPDYSTINGLLPSTYRTSFGTPGTISSSMPIEAVQWMKQLQAEKDKYPPYKPEQLKHPALDGEMKRSKSEVIIANILFQAGIPYVYEVPMFIDGEMLLPDFRILSLIDLKTEIIIEHQGMVFLDSYANKFIKSLKLYLQQSEWIPNKSLFFTFDDAKETLNPNQVLSILRKYIDPSI